MGALRSALYLDFDNVFSGLLKMDPAVALEFAEAPRMWLDRLASSDDHPRRWLVLRCYMNPAGSVPDPRTGGRVPFFRFRSAFTDAGFEVIDCPRLSTTKNGADIRLVIDAVEALQADARYDEFVIASGDSDMTPLLVRLRSADRAVTLMSPSDSAVVMRSVADRLIDGDDLLELVDASAGSVAETLDEIVEAAVVEAGVDADRGAGLRAEQRFAQLVIQRYDAADQPILLSALADDVLDDVGPVAKETGWFGHQTFGRALRALDAPGASFSALHMWDSRRHTPPDVKEAVVRVTAALKLPTLPPESWRSICAALAEFAASHEFNLTEATRWARDRVAETGHRVNRSAVGVVARGAAFGGAALYNQPPPSSEEIARAFVDNLLKRAAAADLEMTASDAQDVREWFGAAGPGAARAGAEVTSGPASP